MGLASHLRVLQCSGSTYRVTIPRDVVDEMGLTDKEDLYIKKNEGHIEMYPVEVQPRTQSIKPKEVE